MALSNVATQMRPTLLATNHPSCVRSYNGATCHNEFHLYLIPVWPPDYDQTKQNSAQNLKGGKCGKYVASTGSASARFDAGHPIQEEYLLQCMLPRMVACRRQNKGIYCRQGIRQDEAAVVGSGKCANTRYAFGVRTLVVARCNEFNTRIDCMHITTLLGDFHWR